MWLFESMLPDALALTDKHFKSFLEKTKLTAERKLVEADYDKLKDEVTEAEQIRKTIYSVVRTEQQRTQLHRAQDRDR